MTSDRKETPVSDAWKPDIVIYHADCADGFGAAWACRERWPDSVFVAANYGQQPPEVEGLHVLIVDFSYPLAVLEEMIYAGGASSIMVLDHHKTARAELEPFAVKESSPGALSADDVGGIFRDLEELAAPPIVALFDMDRSGARLAWDFCHPNVTAPLLIRLIEDRDLWRHQYEASRPFATWLRSEPFSFERFDRILVELERPFGNDLMREALAMQKLYDQKVEEIAEFAANATIEGYSPIVVNCPPAFASDVGNRLLELHPDAPFAATWFQTGRSVMWSLRSTDDRVDVSTVAKERGGGGHRNAAGFTVALAGELAHG
jgi:oligoribonuclease NrnB/cAMP/cGMP phosphodiesterase (DHH superfamily)